ARRQNDIRQSAIVDFYGIHAVAQAAAQRVLVDRPGVRRRQTQAVVADGEAIEPDVCGDVGQDPTAGARHGYFSGDGRVVIWPRTRSSRVGVNALTAPSAIRNWQTSR